LLNGQVAAHPFIRGELLMGNVGGGRNSLLSDYEQLEEAPLVANDEVDEFVKVRNLSGRGIGWIDAHLLASVVVANTLLWTAHKRLEVVAKELGVSFSP
jgi:hypothetical protein